MTYEEIVAYTRSKMAEVDISGYKGHLAAQVNITGEGEGAFYVEINDSNAVVEPYEYFDRDVVLIASADVFTSIVDGKKDAVAAYLTGGLKVRTRRTEKTSRKTRTCQTWKLRRRFSLRGMEKKVLAVWAEKLPLNILGTGDRKWR